MQSLNLNKTRFKSNGNQRGLNITTYGQAYLPPLPPSSDVMFCLSYGAPESNQAEFSDAAFPPWLEPGTHVISKGKSSFVIVNPPGPRPVKDGDNNFKITLTRFRSGGGGGEFCPRRLWTLIGFSIFRQTLPKLVTFSTNYLTTI